MKSKPPALRGLIRAASGVRVMGAVVGVAAVGAVGLGAAGSVAGASSSPARRGPGTALAIGVARQHLAYEAFLVDATLGRLSGGDAVAAAAVREAVRRPDAELSGRLAAADLSSAGARAAWDDAVGTGAPRPGESALHFCSLGVRRSEAAELGATDASSLGEALASIEMGLLVEGRQLATALPPTLRSEVDGAERSALHALAPMLIPTDRDFAAGA